jgi:[acyl-carrier-protein] S-malonyltransferase
MAEAGFKRPGTMAAVLGMAIPDLEEALKELAPQGVAVVANDNCPGQVVISGDVNAIAAAGALLPERGAKRVLGLNVSGAFHSPLMEDSARQMAEALGSVSFGSGRGPVVSNVTAMAGSDWASLLEQQLKSRVRWTESVLAIKAAGVTALIECGAGEVLSGMIRRIDRDLRTLKVVDAATLGEVRAADFSSP